VVVFVVVPGSAAAADRALDRGPRSSAPTGAPVSEQPFVGAPDPVLVMRRNGFLTRASGSRPRVIALDWLRDHRAAFGLDAGDVAGLELVSSQRSPLGLRRVQLAQSAHGIPSFGGGVRATLDERGRLVSVSGAPRADLGSLPAPDPNLDAADAVGRAFELTRTHGRVDQLGTSTGPRRETHFVGGHVARLVWFGPELAWRVFLAADSTHVFDVLVDASDGSLLMRRNLVKSATGSAWDNHPGAALGGSAQIRDFTGPGWLVPGSQLRGPSAWVYADPLDDIYDQPGEEPPDTDSVQIRPAAGNWNHVQLQFPHVTNDGRSCPVATGFGTCSWDSFDSATRDDNKDQSGTQLFYFVNSYHDHLKTANGIGFTSSVGAFEGGDFLQAQVLDGIALAPQTFFQQHTNNANMLTLPDGISPRMQMYLFTNPDVAPEPGVNTGINDVNGADDAAIVYHEYTHGMNNRLVCCDMDGFSLLGGPQSGAMDEAWADWYAMDFLEETGSVSDTAVPGEVEFGVYEHLEVRSQPVDCPASGGGSECPGAGNAGPGGYTYGDFAKIVPLDGPPADGIPDGEVHADGEIWASTLWDLRTAMIAAHGRADGIARTRGVVTGAMVLSPGFPDFLDMRDAILAANTALGLGQADCERIWTAFAARGMGSNAAASGDGDTTPTEGFANPGAAACAPAPPPGGGGPGAAGRPGPGGGALEAPDLTRARARVRVSRTGVFTYSFLAPAGTRGTVVFKTRNKVIVSRRAKVTIAKKSFTVPRSGRVALRIKLSRKNLRVLRRNRKVSLNVNATVRDSTGRTASGSRRLTMLAPKRR
jgi:extracellular elastinolytic metalloproteinase